LRLYFPVAGGEENKPSRRYERRRKSIRNRRGRESPTTE
jgi:hypothetical protein